MYVHTDSLDIFVKKKINRVGLHCQSKQGKGKVLFQIGTIVKVKTVVLKSHSVKSRWSCGLFKSIYTNIKK